MKSHIPHIKNFRDLGGIVTEDGRTVAPCRLLRSSQLYRLTDRGARRLRERFLLRTVVDLRLESECHYRPDTIPDGVTRHRIPLLPEGKRSAIRRDNREEVLRTLILRPDGAAGSMEEDYRELVTDTVALDGLRRFLLLLKEHGDGSVLWHCSLGKDRAGVATAALLMALGVSREHIFRDYMRTQIAYRRINRLYCLGVLFLKRSRTWSQALRAVLDVSPQYLQAVFDTIDARYGGTDGFLYTALRLEHTDIAALRAAYLI